MADNEFVGSAATVRWIWTTGTSSLHADYRTFSYTPSIEYIDATAGADSQRRRLPSFKDGQASLSMLCQSNFASADYVGLAEGVLGSIEYSPAGTQTAGSLKLTIPARSQGVTFNSPYNDVVAVDISWMQSGTVVVGTN